MAGDIRSSFDLNDRPATAAMRRLRREGELTDTVYERLGKTIDETFSEKNVAEIDNYERKLKSVSRQATTSLSSMRREWGKTERDVLRSISVQEAAVDSLSDRLDRLSHKRASPKVNMDGIAEALAQTELLEARLNALSRETVRPRVSVGGTTSSAFRAGAGGGGGRSGLKIPFAGSIPLPLAGAALAAVSPLTGATVATAGSLGGAALGAGALGVAAGGVGAAAIGESAPVIIGAISGIKEASKALKAYQEEVIKSGPNSEAARQSYRKLNMELNATPGARQFLHARTQLSSEFKEATAPARADVTAIGTRGLNLGRQLTPQFSRLSNRFFGEARPQADQFGDFLANDQSRAFFESMGRESTAALAPTENIAENVTATMMNLARSARPFFHEGLEFLDKWTGGWRKSSGDIGNVRDDMSGWMTDLKAWGQLTGSTFRLLRDLMAGGEKSGTSMVEDLTKQLDTWDGWIKRNPRQVRQFFKDSVDSTEKLAAALGKITKFLWQIGQALTPLLTQVSQFVTFASNAGLLAPGMLPLLLGAGAGIRNARGAAQTRILGGAGTPMILGGGLGSTAATRGVIPSRAPVMTPTPYGPIELPLQERGIVGGRIGAAVTRGGMFARGFGAQFLPYAALSAGVSAAGQPGGVEEKLQAGLAGLTMNTLYSTPETTPQQRDKGSAQAAAITRRILRQTGSSPAGLRRARARIQAAIGKTAGMAGENFFSGGRLGGEAAGVVGFAASPVASALGFGPSDIFGAGGDGIADPERKARLERLIAAEKELRAQSREGNLNKGQETLADIQGAYGVNRRHGVQGASRSAISSIGSHLKGTRSIATLETLGQGGLDFAHELEAANPKLRAAVNELTETVVQRMRAMGRQVDVIHGNIVDVSAKSWSQIADKIGSETQRAYAEANKNLTALERRAIEILQHMGFSAGDARGLALSAAGEHGKKSETAANTVIQHGSPIPYSPGYINKATGKKGNASGGRLPYPAGGGDRDEVHLGNNQWGAGGEVVVPSHVERRINRMLGNANTGTTLGREVAMNNRAHWQMAGGDYGLGGRMHRFASGGILAAASLAERMGMGVSGGPGPGGGIPSSGHVGDSLHYSGLAYDVTGSPAQMRRYFLNAWRQFHGSINELFYDPMGYYYDQGHKVAGAIGGHSDHVHIGFFPGGAHFARGAGRLAGARNGRASGQEIHLKGHHTGMGGLAGAITNRANDMVAAGYSQRLNKLTGGAGGAARGPGALGGATGTLRFPQIVQLARRAGMSNPTLMAHIAEAESGGRTGVVNSIGATGLWQIYNHPDLVAKYGPMTNAWNNARAAADLLKTQGLGAWAASQGSWGQYAATGGRTRRGFAGWFANGFRGRVSGPTVFGAGEAGEEDVSITPTTRSKRLGRRSSAAMPVVHVNMGGVTIANGQDAKRLAEEIGTHAARRIKKALEDSDGVREEELTGG